MVYDTLQLGSGQNTYDYILAQYHAQQIIVTYMTHYTLL